MLGAREMQWFFDHYEPDPADRENPEISPLRAATSRDLPPAIVVVAELTPARRGRGLRAALEEAGVAVSLHRYPDDAQPSSRS